LALAAPGRVPSLAGGATGSLDPGILSDTGNAFFNSFTEGFTPGSQLSFLLQFSNNGGCLAVHPASFRLRIPDSSGFEIPPSSLTPLSGAVAAF
jgi:hypothetical protein